MVCSPPLSLPSQYNDIIIVMFISFLLNEIWSTSTPPSTPPRLHASTSQHTTDFCTVSRCFVSVLTIGLLHHLWGTPQKHVFKIKCVLAMVMYILHCSVRSTTIKSLSINVMIAFFVIYYCFLFRMFAMPSTPPRTADMCHCPARRRIGRTYICGGPRRLERCKRYPCVRRYPIVVTQRGHS